LDICRRLYNRLLQDQNEAKEKGIKLWTYDTQDNDTQNMIPSMKLENPKLNQVYSKALQTVDYTPRSDIKELFCIKEERSEDRSYSLQSAWLVQHPELQPVRIW